MPANLSDPAAPPETNIPLCVDLDGTIIETDLLLEGCRTFFRQAKLADYRHLLSLRKGRAAFKAVIAGLFPLDVRALPYRASLLDFLREQRQSRSQILLVTAAHESLAHALAEHLDLFDSVMASTGDHNLKGPNKGAALCDRFGAGGFDYIGDSRADLPVWQKARRAYLTGPKADQLKAALHKIAPQVEATILR